MLKKEKSLQILKVSEELAINQIVRCEVQDSKKCKLLFPLSSLSYSDPSPSLTPVPPNTKLPLLEVTALQTEEGQDFPPVGSFLNALVLQSDDTTYLSTSNLRLSEHRQSSSTQRTSFTLGPIKSSSHPMTAPDFSIYLNQFIEDSGLNSCRYLKSDIRKRFDLVRPKKEKISKHQDLTWSDEKFEEAFAIYNKHPKTALKLLEDSLMLNPENLEALRLRVKIRIDRKEKAKAEADLKKILDMDPGNRFALEILDDIRNNQKTRLEIKDKRLINSGFERDLVYSP